MGGAGSDIANGLAVLAGTVYMVGQSATWSSGKTDMTFLAVDPAAETVLWATSMGGAGDDIAVAIAANTADGSLYALGYGDTPALSAGSIDVYVIRYGTDGTLAYLATLGGSNPDYGVDIAVFGNKVFVTGQSGSPGMSSGFQDIFVAAMDKDTSSTLWVRYIGTPSFNEYSASLSVMPDGSLYLLGQIQANGFTNGGTDLLIAQLSLSGDQVLLEYLGSSMNEEPVSLVFSGQRATVLANTNSVGLKNQGGMDWLVF